MKWTLQMLADRAWPQHIVVSVSVRFNCLALTNSPQSVLFAVRERDVELDKDDRMVLPRRGDWDVAWPEWCQLQRFRP